MKINTEKLYELYMLEVDKICEECDWKTSFTAQECVQLVAHILERNTELITNE